MGAVQKPKSKWTNATFIIYVTHLDLITDLETFIFEHQLLKAFGQFDMVSYIML